MRRPDESVETRLSVLEHTVVSQNSSIDQRLDNLQRILSEIHDKLDGHVLKQSVDMVKAQSDIKKNSEKIEEVKAARSRDGKIIMTILAAIVGGIFSIPELFFKK